MAQPLFLIGAGIFVVLGVAHAYLTLLDMRAPRALIPIDDDVRRGMTGTALRLAPRTSVWSCWVGFNLSHSLGLIVFGGLLGGLALQDFGMVSGSALLRWSPVLIAVTYIALAVRFWFWLPAVASAIGALCFTASAISGRP